MSDEQALRAAFIGVEVDDAFTEAAVELRDGSKLHFRHRVGERWVRAAGADGGESATSLAGRLLGTIRMFRLNGKHLDVQFADASRWEVRFARPGRPT